jgi:nucleoside-triphosphatase THEP1
MVAAFGALWGALEITLGSFLHAVKIPFGGTTLAIVSATLLVAQRQILPARGLSLATGVVAALCKSVSPGGVILGPMIAITVEALLVEVALLAAPKSRVSAALAGSLVVLWATFQKVISHYVYFGGGVIDLYIALLEQGARTVGLTSEAGWRVVGLLVVAVALAGALFAQLGYRVGRLALARLGGEERRRASSLFELPVLASMASEQERAQGQQGWKVRAIRLVTWLVAFGCIALQVGRRLDLAALALVIWLVTLSLVDRRALNRLRMPKFWTIMILVALGSGLLLGTRDIDLWGLRFSRQGLEAGALMVIRGAFIFGLASWATRNINGRLARRIAAKVGLGNLALAVATAFGVLPALMDQLGWSKRDDRRVWKERLASGGQLAVEAVTEAARLAERLVVDLAGARQAQLVVVSGAPGAGKTTSIDLLVASLRARGVAVGGVTQPALEVEGGRAGYDVLDLNTGDRRSLACKSSGVHGFDFDDKVWGWAGERLAQAQGRDQVVVIDELGRLEARGEGHLVALRELVSRPGRAAVLLASVRSDCLDLIVEQIGEPVLHLEAPLSPGEGAEAVEHIEAVVQKARDDLA